MGKSTVVVLAKPSPSSKSTPRSSTPTPNPTFSLFVPSVAFVRGHYGRHESRFAREPAPQHVIYHVLNWSTSFGTIFSCRNMSSCDVSVSIVILVRLRQALSSSVARGISFVRRIQQ